ncbi:MAG TPA: hypothetical protein VFA56_09700 [Gaiellaceae bacterium]|nr:hypothetical protein [Gaiellaceae bacterium]
MRWSGLMRWWAPLGALVAVRIAVPLAALAAEGSRLPGLPRFDRAARDGGLTGDATGFYAATREFMAAWGRMPRPVLALDALLVLGAAVALSLLWRRRAAWRPWVAAAAAWVVAVAIAVDVHWMQFSGAAVFGWPLLWAFPLAAWRVLGLGLTKSVAWDVGVALSIALVGLTVVAVAYFGRNATGRRQLGLAAAAVWALWPLLVGVLAGHHAWANGQWEVDAGLHNYSEPLSTLLVTSGGALLLSPRLTRMRLVLAGCALSFATLVKLSNALVAAAALVVVFARGRARETVPYLAGALSFAPLVAVYWPISYPKLFDNRNSWPRDPFDPAHVVTSWTHSSMFDPRTLAIVTPLAVVGALALRRPWPLALVLAFLLVNPIFYSFYANTAQHPRFLYASLPALFVLWAAGASLLASLARSRLARSPA